MRASTLVAAVAVALAASSGTASAQPVIVAPAAPVVVAPSYPAYSPGLTIGGGVNVGGVAIGGVYSTAPTVGVVGGVVPVGRYYPVYGRPYYYPGYYGYRPYHYPHHHHHH